MYKSVGYFRRKKILRHANFLDLTPMAQHRHEMESDGTVKVLVPRFTGRPLGSWLQKRARHPHMFLSLDELGSATWLLCNGDHSVRQICQALKGRFGEKASQAEDRVTTFLSALYQKNLITFREIVPAPEKTAGGSTSPSDEKH
jgi:uncharacterized protein (DUF2249 family)